MRIRFPWLKSADYLNYIYDRPRYSTMTSVHILDDKTLAACHFAGKSMFLVSFDINTAEYEILDRIDTTVDGVPVCTDLMHGLGDMLVTSNFHKGTQSFYEVAGGGIHHRRDIKPPNGYTKCHGVRFIPEDYGVSSLLATTFNSKSNPSILFMAIDTGAIHCELKIKDTLPFWLRRRNILPQDLYLVGDRMLVPCRADHISKKPGGNSDNHAKYTMLLYQVDLRKPKFRLLDILTGSGHIDNLAYRDGVFYATDQYYSKVINYRIERDRIKQVGEMIGYDFPHGLDIRDDLLAVSNYGDNSVVINRL